MLARKLMNCNRKVTTNKYADRFCVVVLIVELYCESLVKRIH
jgi:hypothetical protein